MIFKQLEIELPNAYVLLICYTPSPSMYILWTCALLPSPVQLLEILLEFSGESLLCSRPNFFNVKSTLKTPFFK